jgi:7-cyano-7-deazaguanine synthase
MSRKASAAVLLSGGMDSLALAAWQKPAVAFTVDYGQACAAAEIRASRSIARELALDHHVIRVDCSALGSGDLAGRPPNPLAPSPEWWPFRNQLLVTLAAMKAVTMGVSELMVGSVRGDGFHADGTKNFYANLDRVVRLQEGNLTVLTPAIELSSPELVRRSGIAREILAWAHSCHVANYACGQCRGCNKHREVLAALGYEPY